MLFLRVNRRILAHFETVQPKVLEFAQKLCFSYFKGDHKQTNSLSDHLFRTPSLTGLLFIIIDEHPGLSLSKPCGWPRQARSIRQKVAVKRIVSSKSLRAASDLKMMSSSKKNDVRGRVVCLKEDSLRCCCVVPVWRPAATQRASKPYMAAQRALSARRLSKAIWSQARPLARRAICCSVRQTRRNVADTIKIASGATLRKRSKTEPRDNGTVCRCLLEPERDRGTNTISRERVARRCRAVAANVFKTDAQIVGRIIERIDVQRFKIGEVQRVGTTGRRRYAVVFGPIRDADVPLFPKLLAEFQRVAFAFVGYPADGRSAAANQQVADAVAAHIGGPKRGTLPKFDGSGQGNAVNVHGGSAIIDLANKSGDARRPSVSAIKRGRCQNGIRGVAVAFFDRERIFQSAGCIGVADLWHPSKGDPNRAVEVGCRRVMDQRHEVGPELSNQPVIADGDIGMAQAQVGRTAIIPAAAKEVKFKLRADGADAGLCGRPDPKAGNAHAGVKGAICGETGFANSANAAEIALLEVAVKESLGSHEAVKRDGCVVSGRELQTRSRANVCFERGNPFAQCFDFTALVLRGCKCRSREAGRENKWVGDVTHNKGLSVRHRMNRRYGKPATGLGIEQVNAGNAAGTLRVAARAPAMLRERQVSVSFGLQGSVYSMRRRGIGHHGSQSVHRPETCIVNEMAANKTVLRSVASSNTRESRAEG